MQFGLFKELVKMNPCDGLMFTAPSVDWVRDASVVRALSCYFNSQKKKCLKF